MSEVLNWTMLGSIGQLLAAAFVAIGFIFITWQIRVGSKVASADLILRLESEFVTHHIDAYRKLSTGPWSAEGAGPSTPEESVELECYMTFFATLQILRLKNLVDLPTIDKMFALRFFVVAHNPHAHATLRRQSDYWGYFRGLYMDWVQLREAEGNRIPLGDHAMAF